MKKYIIQERVARYYDYLGFKIFIYYDYNDVLLIRLWLEIEVFLVASFEENGDWFGYWKSFRGASAQW